jgi:hypothetical protein
MAVIADVHTAYPGGYLEETVGAAAEIYVVVPMNVNAGVLLVSYRNVKTVFSFHANLVNQFYSRTSRKT